MFAPATARRWRVLYFAVNRAGSDPLEHGNASTEAHFRRSPSDRICSRPEPHANVRDTDTVCDRDHLVLSLGYDRWARNKSKHRCKQEEWPDDECEAAGIRPGSAFLRYRNRQRSCLAFSEYNLAVRPLHIVVLLL